MNAYAKLREKHQREVNDFPFFFAFNDKQFSEGMASLGLTPDDTDQIYRLGGTGGFYRRSDADRLHEMFDRHSTEMQAAIDADLTGDGFIFDMFSYELANHEYTYTGDISDTLEALGLTVDEVNRSKSLRRGLKQAVKKQKGVTP